MIRPQHAPQAGRRAIGLDIGGTKIAGGIVTAEGRLLRRILIPTPNQDDGASFVDAVRRLIDELRADDPAITAVGAGAAGLIDWPDGHIRWAPNNAYRQLPLRRLLAAHTGLPTTVDNDANVAAWAEARVGAGAGHDDLIVLTIGTGIGAGVVVGGKLFRGRSGIGGEAGHLIVDPAGGQRCGCGATGCLEAMASGRALGRSARAVAAADPDGHLATVAGGADKVTGETVFQAARDADSIARSLFDEIGYWLGAGIASLANLFDPEVVILAGGLIATGDLLLIPTRASYETFLFARAHRTVPALLPARLGTDAGVIGAALLALDTSSPILQPVP